MSYLNICLEVSDLGLLGVMPKCGDGGFRKRKRKLMIAPVAILDDSLKSHRQ